MNPKYVFLAALLFSLNTLGQSPISFNYQTVVRTLNGTIIPNAEIKMRISILQGELPGNSVCTETFSTTTNSFGMVNLAIGSNNQSDFSQIDWSKGPYFMKVELDTSRDSNFSLIGISQLLAVPYAFHAIKAESTIETDPIFNNWDKSSGIAIKETQISDLKHFKNSDEIDPIFSKSAAAMITVNDIEKWNNRIETDPIFKQSAAKNITNEQISIWNNKSEFDGKYNSLTGTPTIAKVAVSGSYRDLINIPENIVSVLEAPQAGELLYFDGNNWVTLPKGKAGQILTIDANGMPFWK